MLNIKKVSLVAMLSKLWKSCFGMLRGFSLSLYKLSTQILMVSSKGILVNKESMSKLAMCTKWNESMKVNSLAVEGVKNFSKTLLICR